MCEAHKMSEEIKANEKLLEEASLAWTAGRRQNVN